MKVSGVPFHLLHSGGITQKEIQRYVHDADWQELRRTLKGMPLMERFSALRGYLDFHQHSRAAQVRVTNYINALSRGGLIAPIERRKA